MLNKLFENLILTDHARTAQFETEKYLTDHGFNCKLELMVPNRGDGRRGRVDILAIKDDLKLAIEIDDHTPRKKSIFKLKSLGADYIKCIICRNQWNISKDNYYGINIVFPAKLIAI